MLAMQFVQSVYKKYAILAAIQIAAIAVLFVMCLYMFLQARYLSGVNEGALLKIIQAEEKVNDALKDSDNASGHNGYFSLDQNQLLEIQEKVVEMNSLSGGVSAGRVLTSLEEALPFGVAVTEFKYDRSRALASFVIVSSSDNAVDSLIVAYENYKDLHIFLVKRERQRDGSELHSLEVRF